MCIRDRDMTIDQPNQVWATDITYIPMQRGFLYLAAILDWATRRVLAWRLSNTLTADFCVEAFKEAIARYGQPTIFNTDPVSYTHLAGRAVEEGDSGTSQDIV